MNPTYHGDEKNGVLACHFFSDVIAKGTKLAIENSVRFEKKLSDCVMAS